MNEIKTFKYLNRNKKKTLLYVSLILLLLVRIVVFIYRYNYKYNSFRNVTITVKVICIEKVEEERIRYRVKYNGDTFLLFLKDVNNVYSYGDEIVIRASLYEIESKGNPYEFNYKRYLNSNGFVSVLYANIAKNKNSEKDIMSLIYLLRDKVDYVIDSNLTVKKANLLKSILYGNDVYLDENIKEMFTEVGLGHILCVSGTHVAFLIFSFENITKSKKSKILRIILLLFFYIFSLFNISLLRAIVMSILAMFKRYNNVYKRYVIVLYIVLVINPYYLFNIGVIFSFLSILGIIVFNLRINSFLSKSCRFKTIKIVIDSVSVTVSSQVLILPIEIAVFGKITLFSILSNLLVSSVIIILLNLGFSVLFFIFIPLVSIHLFQCINLVIDILFLLLKILNNVNYFNIYLPRFNMIMYIMYYLFIILVIVGDKIWIYFWNIRKQIKKWIRMTKMLCLVYIVLNIVYIQYFESYVIYFNVGQGNMALIHNKIKNVVVDMGSTEKNIAYNVMKSFLKAKNIRNIDLVCITHMHTDHMNGVEELIQDKEINVKRIGYSIPCMNVEEYYYLIKAIRTNNVAKIEVNENDNIEIGKIKIEVLSPPRNKYIKDEDMLNANSTIYNIQNDKKVYMFMGDATKKTERYILKKYKEKIRKVKCFQVSHHGSSTSSYEPFISELNDAICIISSKKKVYGHPSEAILNILNKYKLKYMITENDGAFIFY